MRLKDIVFCISHRIPCDKNIWLPLAYDELKSLAVLRRIKCINERFSFGTAEIIVNHTFRSRLNKDGKCYRIEESLKEFPMIVASLLKHKRHEWQIYGLADDDKIKYMWTNKGNTADSVSFSGDFTQMIILAKQAQCETIIRVHNHPGAYTLTPSDTDLNSFGSLKNLFEQNKLNFIDIICARSKYNVFGYNFFNEYVEQEAGIKEVEKENNVSPKANWELRKELHSNKNIKILLL